MCQCYECSARVSMSETLLQNVIQQVPGAHVFGITLTSATQTRSCICSTVCILVHLYIYCSVYIDMLAPCKTDREA